MASIKGIMAQGKPFTITDLRGGLNDTDPITTLPYNQATIAQNVEFHCASREDHSTIGTRRAGTEAITTPITAGNDVVLLHRHLPTTDPTEAELWAIDSNGTTATVRYKDTSWHTATPVDTIDVSGTKGYHIYAQTLHKKLFFAFKSSANRLHVRDVGSTTIRKVGLAEPAAPSVANTGSGSFSGTRYYRVRYTVQASGVTVLRSEPSDATTFAPSGSGSAARITKPASISESETHWEVEASLDNANFYRIATLAVGTTTYDDSTAFSTGYATTGTLSEDVGDYTPLHSAKFITADDDRLLVGGSWEDSSLSSRVAWTPVLNDPGAGNDERSPVDTDNFIDLDTFEGGELTGLSHTVNGYIFAFKRSHIYQLTRTGQRTRAYTAHALSKTRGALEGSIVEAVDQNGKPCLYFIDPAVGPCRVGDGGVQTCGQDIHKTWESVNKDATIITRSLYYPESSQIHWWVATGSSETPNLLIVLHVKHTVQTQDGIRRGWVKFTGTRATAISSCMFSDNIEDNTARSNIVRPFIGLTDGTIHMCDVGDDDNGTAYVSKIRSAPVAIDVLNLFGIMEAGLVAQPSDNVAILIKAVRNFGEEIREFEIDLTGNGATVPETDGESGEISFEASADHATIDSYLIRVYAVGTTSPVVDEIDIGKPAPDGDNVITYDLSAFLDALAPGDYVVVVCAVDNGAPGLESDPSNTFTIPLGTGVSATTSEDVIIRSIDNFRISESMAVQIEFSDKLAPEGPWNLFYFAASPRKEGN